MTGQRHRAAARATTRARAGERELMVLQITDTHLFADEGGALLGLQTEQSLRDVLADVQRRYSAVDLVLATGDLVHDGSREGYRRFREHFSRLRAPVHCLAGNHDEASLLGTLLNEGSIRSTDHVCLEGWQFIFLDSTLPGSAGGHLADAQLELLEERLTAAPRLHALVCLHHQPVPVGSRWMDTMAVDNPRPFFSLIDRHPNVRGILWGHVHQDFDRLRNGVRLMASPSTCIQFRPGSEAFALDAVPPGYRWLRFHPDGRIETGIHRLPAAATGIDYGSGGY
jgi:Icc protein